MLMRDNWSLSIGLVSVSFSISVISSFRPEVFLQVLVSIIGHIMSHPTLTINLVLMRWNLIKSIRPKQRIATLFIWISISIINCLRRSSRTRYIRTSLSIFACDIVTIILSISQLTASVKILRLQYPLSIVLLEHLFIIFITSIAQLTIIIALFLIRLLELSIASLTEASTSLRLQRILVIIVRVLTICLSWLVSVYLRKGTRKRESFLSTGI